MFQHRVDVINPQTGYEIWLDPITNANVNQVASALLPPDRLAARWLITNDARHLESPDSYIDHYLESDVTDEQMWVIKMGETAIGFSHLWYPDTEEPGISTYITRSVNLRKGIGTMARTGLIATHAFYPGSDAKVVQTSTLEGNEAALRSLTKMGFYTIGYGMNQNNEHTIQRVDGQPNRVPKLIVVNPDSHPSENGLARTQRGQASQAQFTAHVQGFKIFTPET